MTGDEARKALTLAQSALASLSEVFDLLDNRALYESTARDAKALADRARQESQQHLQAAAAELTAVQGKHDKTLAQYTRTITSAEARIADLAQQEEAAKQRLAVVRAQVERTIQEGVSRQRQEEQQAGSALAALKAERDQVKAELDAFTARLQEAHGTVGRFVTR